MSQNLEWYYAHNNDRKTCTFNELAALLKAGTTVSNATLVWNSTMTDWKVLADLPEILAELVEEGNKAAKEWYYVDKNTSAQAGPIVASEFAQLHSTGVVDEKTLVWKPSLSEWSPFSSVKELGQYIPAPTPAAPQEWYYVDSNRKKAGPFAFSAVEAAYNNKSISENTLIWKIGLPEWVKLNACTEPEATALLMKSAAPAKTGTGAEGETDKKRKNKSKKKKNWAAVQNHANVYVQGLPKDTTVQELLEFFSDCGTFKLDYQGKPKVKVYTDENGQPKGDGLVCFANEASVNLAITLKDDADFRPQVKIQVQKADFQMKGGEYVQKILSTEEKAAFQKSKLEMKKKLSWNEGMYICIYIYTEKEKESS